MSVAAQAATPSSHPLHNAVQSRHTVEAALGAPLESLFLSFESRPLASGSIAQVGVVQQGSHFLWLCRLHTSSSSACLSGDTAPL